MSGVRHGAAVIVALLLVAHRGARLAPAPTAAMTPRVELPVAAAFPPAPGPAVTPAASAIVPGSVQPHEHAPPGDLRRPRPAAHRRPDAQRLGRRSRSRTGPAAGSTGSSSTP